MDAGIFNQKIIIEKLKSSYDTNGNPIERWTPFCRAYAYMNGLSGKEYWEAAVLNAENTVDFLCRWKQSFKMLDMKSYRIDWNGKKFNIKSIDNIRFENKYIKIRAVHSDE